MKYQVIGGVALLGIGIAVGHFNAPTKIETKIEEKIVYKEAQVKNRTVYVKETKSPDGTIVREETVKEKEKTKTSTVSDKTTEEETSYYTPQYHVSLFATTPLTAPQYGVAISKRFIGPFTLGVVGTYDSQRLNYGVTIGMMF